MAAQALPRREMQLFVKLLDGRTRGFQLGRSEPLHTVKRQLEKSEGVFEREYSKVSVRLDCGKFEAEIKPK